MADVGTSGSPVWTRFVSFLVRHRLFLGAFALVMTIAAGITAPGVQPMGDPTAYLPADRHDVKFWRDMSQRFDAFNMLIVGLEEPQGRPLSFDGLSRLTRITDRLSEMKAEGILHARSVTNVQTQHVDEEGTVVADLMIPAIPRSEANLKALGRKILDDSQVPGALVSRDLHGYVVIVRTDPRKDQGDIAALAMDVVEAERGDLSATYFGAGFVTHQIGVQVYRQLPWVVPAFGAGLFLVLLVWLRRPVAVLLVLACTAIPLLWWVGFLGLAGLPVTVAVLNGALLLLPVGAVAFARAAESRLGGREAFLPRRTLTLFGAGAVAFAALAVYNRMAEIPLPYLARFGEAMIVGFVALAVFALVAAVPLLSLLKPGVLPLPPSALDARPVLRASNARRTMAIALAAILIVLGMLGASRMRFAIGLGDMFSSREPVGQSLDFFDRRFGGSDFIQVHVDGDFSDPAVLGRVHRLVDLIDGSRLFPDVRAVTQVLAFLNTGMGGGINWIPPERDAVENLWFFLEGNEDIRPMVVRDRDEGMVTIRMPAGYGDGGALVHAVEQAIQESAVQGRPAARKRLEGLIRAFGVDMPEGQVDSVLDQAGANEPAYSRQGRTARILLELRDYMGSDAAPFRPNGESWEGISSLLAKGDGDELTGALAAAIDALPEFREIDPPEGMARGVAEMLVTRLKDRDRDLQSLELVKHLFEGLPEGSVPVPLRVRARGVLAEWVAGERPEGDVRFTVSGFPALAPIETLLMRGLRVSAALLLAVFALLAILWARRYPGALRAIPEAVVATLVTFAMGWLLGVNVDSGSATLYLIPPTVAWFLSPCLADPDARRGPYPFAFALAFAAAAMSLVLIGILPVTRLGVVMAVGLAASAGAAAAGTWLWEPIRMAYDSLRRK